MRNRIAWAVLAVLLAAVPATAQNAGLSLAQDLLQAIRLPTVTRDARALGVSERDLQDVLTRGRSHGLSAGNLAGLFSEENDAIRANGRIDNFGSFVQSKLDAGLRGRDLAAAIHAEHAKRGMGKMPAANMDASHGKPASPGQSDQAKGTDKPGKPGKSGQQGGK